MLMKILKSLAINRKIKSMLSTPTKYAGDVNKKQQDKIKDFLKSKGIKSDVIDK